MLTLKAINRLLEEIITESDMNENVINKIDRIRNDISDRDRFLSQVGNVIDDDTVEDYEYKLNDTNSDWESKYNDLRERYIRRFFDGDSKSEKEKRDIENIKKDLEFDEEENEENEEIRIEDLY